MKLDRDKVNVLLNAISDQLDLSRCPVIELVVCGGSALQALGLIDRTTRDLDILAFISRNNDYSIYLETAKQLPDYLIIAANTVARDFNLPADWLNSGPTDLLSQGLPDGFIERLQSRRYGSRLVVHFISRYDQICFKMYAAINGGSERHLSDLFILNPSDDDLLSAANWCLTQDASDIFPALVKSFLRKVGFSNVAERLE
ncbi:MAG: DUF6036 family nucleotidyltransferase [Saccharofermentanales bacterium]